ncbi:hypothetical protein NDU88_007165 [Pleurodeles waltl]|uniref:Uncharacterized protein n=1 Tax=Pleurodeles waltl TaxID=8319 RepID=A0AAV7SRP8_PLEWA|nr:hypothetical protein NDU88_007165 [Pleurodeles waltl]
MYAIDLAICSLSYYGGTQNQEFDDDVSRALAATLVAVVKGIEGLLLVLMVVEFCISISTSVFGCKAVCRDSNADMAVIIQHNHPSVQASCPTVVPAPPPMYHLEDQFYFA